MAWFKVLKGTPQTCQSELLMKGHHTGSGNRYVEKDADKP